MKREDAKDSVAQNEAGLARESVAIESGGPAFGAIGSVALPGAERKPTLIEGAMDALETRPIARRAFLQGGMTTALVFIVGPHAARYLMEAASQAPHSIDPAPAPAVAAAPSAGWGEAVADRKAALPSFSVHFLR